MAPYDQRKEEGRAPNAIVNKKISILYEELEDSGSEGSDLVNNAEQNHLASIIEEEEEATEYQRSRSRSKSGSSHPPQEHTNFKRRDYLQKDVTKQHAQAEEIKETKEESRKIMIEKKDIELLKKAKTSKAALEEYRKNEEKKKKKVKELNTLNRLEIPVKEEQFHECKSMKGPNVNQDDKCSQIVQPSMQKESVENSVKLDEQTDEVLECKQVRGRKMRSPVGVKLNGRSTSERSIGIARQVSKPLKLIYSIFSDFGTAKTLRFEEFLHFFTIINVI